MADLKPGSSEDECALPYIATHKRFPPRSLRLRATCQLPRLSRLGAIKDSERETKSPNQRKDLAVDGTSTDEDTPRSPLFPCSVARASSLMARRYFLPKYRWRW